jgi:hypothetical protein
MIDTPDRSTTGAIAFEALRGRHPIGPYAIRSLNAREALEKGSKGVRGAELCYHDRPSLPAGFPFRPPDPLAAARAGASGGADKPGRPTRRPSTGPATRVAEFPPSHPTQEKQHEPSRENCR